MIEEGSLAARLLIVVLIALGVGANAWYQARLWNGRIRFWHGAILGSFAGFVVAFIALD